MLPKRWKEIDDVFQDALDRSPEERGAWLANRCGDDVEMRNEVLALLVAHERPDGILDRSIGALLPRPSEPLRSDRQIGPYRVLREVGRGGMGVVYLAERSDGQFRRRVAIKILRASPDAEELHQRFLGERQILASLDHANIAQLLDGGVTDGQLPYLVMEYVDGLPLTEYCDRHRLSIDERLRLFRDVCAAVHHAHRNLIIHRDLKPGNILVTAAGQVKLLDFGIAKLLNPALSMAQLPETRTSFRVMTPEYASPEQVRGDSLSTASDVYSLGVILYELLTGHRPYLLAGETPIEVARLVCEHEPERPSSRILRASESASELGGGPAITPDMVSAARDSSVERLRRTLQGDIDAIVMMSLRKEPGRRYGSAEALSEDIRRYLEGHPIHARRGSGRYRLRKLVSRHRVSVAAALLVALSLTGGAAVAAWQAGVAARERDRTRDALRESEEVTAFLLGLFEASDPSEAQGIEITARDLLRRGAARADELSGEPSVQRRVLGVLGRVHQNLGDYGAALAFAERALSLEVARYGESHPAVALALSQLAGVQRRLGEFSQAQAHLERALAIQLRTLGSDDAALAETLDDLSAVAVQRGDLVAAEQHAREALQLRRRVLGPGDPQTIGSLARLGSVLRQRGDLTGAERVLREVLESRQPLDRGGSGEASDLVALADILLQDSARAGEAHALYHRALLVEGTSTRRNHAARVAALDGLGRYYQGAGLLDSAEVALNAVVDERRRVYGEEHPWTSGARLHVAILLRGMGRLHDAERAYRDVLAIDRRVRGADHPIVAGTLTALAVTVSEAGRQAEADSLLGEALALREARLGREHYLVATTLFRRAQVAIRRGRFADAERMLQRAAEIAGAQSSAEAGLMRDIQTARTELYAAWGRPQPLVHDTAIRVADDDRASTILPP